MPTHRCPDTHAVRPHTHCPPLHVGARFASHAWHRAPPAPQAPADAPPLQVFPAQHPAHDAPSHTHAPLAQRCPAAHGSPTPHAHAPPRQRSDAAPHAMHAPPPCPQNCAVVVE